MAENSKIAWTKHTFNPWWGCQRVSPGCQHCYAEALDKRVGGATIEGAKVLRWGPKAPRVRTSAANWKLPLKWHKAAEAAGERHRVFCASMADVFEDRPELVPWRFDLFEMIRATPHLDWLVLTKRPENIARLWPNGEPLEQDAKKGEARQARAPLPPPGSSEWPNVWLGTTVEDQQRAFERIPALLKVSAVVRFLSCEPLLERVDLSPLTCPVCGGHDVSVEDLPGEPGFTTQPWCTECDVEMGDPDWLGFDGIDWVIVGGESGHGARPFDIDWARELIGQCRASGAAPFVKQLGARVACEHCDTGKAACVGRYESADREAEMACNECCGHGCEDGHCEQLHDPAGADPAEWPSDLRVREFPTVMR